MDLNFEIQVLYMNKKEKKKYVPNGKIMLFFAVMFLITFSTLFVINMKLSDLEDERLENLCDITCSEYSHAFSYTYHKESNSCFCHVSEDSTDVYDMNEYKIYDLKTKLILDFIVVILIGFVAIFVFKICKFLRKR